VAYDTANKAKNTKLLILEVNSTPISSLILDPGLLLKWLTDINPDFVLIYSLQKLPLLFLSYSTNEPM
jgi:hypothetical protein